MLEAHGIFTGGLGDEVDPEFPGSTGQGTGGRTAGGRMGLDEALAETLDVPQVTGRRVFLEFDGDLIAHPHRQEFAGIALGDTDGGHWHGG